MNNKKHYPTADEYESMSDNDKDVVRKMYDEEMNAKNQNSSESQTDWSLVLGLRDRVKRLTLTDDPEEYYGHKAPSGCVAVRILDQRGERIMVDELPDPGDNADGWKDWSWFWAQGTKGEIEKIIREHSE